MNMTTITPLTTANPHAHTRVRLRFGVFFGPASYRYEKETRGN